MGEPKSPFLSDSWALKMFPAVKLPVTVMGMRKVSPAQMVVLVSPVPEISGGVTPQPPMSQQIELSKSFLVLSLASDSPLLSIKMPTLRLAAILLPAMMVPASYTKIFLLMALSVCSATTMAAGSGRPKLMKWSVL